MADKTLDLTITKFEAVAAWRALNDSDAEAARWVRERLERVYREKFGTYIEDDANGGVM